MGNGSYYGLNDREYYICDGTIITDSSGLVGKVVTEIGDTDYHSSPPSWSKTSQIYFKRSDEGDHEIEQMRVYNKDRRAALDFDWGHKHQEYPKGIVHVHEWGADKKGNWIRRKPRPMKPEEVRIYSEILLKSNPKVKFNP